MIQKFSEGTTPEPNPLLPEEQAILDELCRLFAEGYEEVPEEFMKRMDETIHWSFDDPASIERGLYFLERDPYYRREVQIINAEFAAADLADRRGIHAHPSR